MEGETASLPYQPKSIGMLLTIVGTRYYTSAEKLDDYLKKAPSCRMILMAEPNNPVDPNAVAVFDLDRGCIVGHVCCVNLPMVHQLMSLHRGATIYLHVYCSVPLHPTYLMAYPMIDGKEITDLSGPEVSQYFNSLNVFSVLERLLPSMHAEVRKIMYSCFRYLRDYLGLSIPQRTLSAFCKSVENDKYSIQANSCAPTLKVDGGVNQVAFGNGLLSNNH